MSEHRNNKNCNYILHSGKDNVMFFAFPDNNFYPAYLIRIYNKSKRYYIDKMQELWNKINACHSDLLKNSIPRLIKLEESSKYYVLYREYLKGVAMENYAERAGLFWKRDFFDNLDLVTMWLIDLYKNFLGKHIIIPRDRILFLFNKVEIFLRPALLNIPLEDIEIPTVISHCDFRPTNIIRDKDRIIVIDWDRFQLEGLPLFDLLNFILRYLHAHYKFQKEKMYLEPEIFLKYFNLFYLKKNSVSLVVKGKINLYVKTVGLDEKQKGLLLLLWLYNMLYIGEKDKFSPFKTESNA